MEVRVLSDTIVSLDTDERGVACVTLNRPEVHNAFNPAMIEALHSIIRDVGKDDSIRAVTLTGAGKSFSAGADLNWMRESASYDREKNISDAGKLSALLEDLAILPKPTMALVRGAAEVGDHDVLAAADRDIGDRRPGAVALPGLVPREDQFLG